MATDKLLLKAQAALDELMREARFIFALEARTLINEGNSQNTIHFDDSIIIFNL
jgi:hypothetical protein